MWRGTAVVIGRDGKNVIVMHGGLLREVAKVHVTRRKEKKIKRVKKPRVRLQKEVMKRRRKMRVSIRVGGKGTRIEEEEMELEEVEEIIPRMKKGERYEIKRKEMVPHQM